MVMTVYGQEIPCARAEKGTDIVRAYDESGACVFEAAKVTDFSGYTLDGGEWSTAEPTTAEQVAALAASVQSVQTAACIAFVTLAEAGSIDAETAAEHTELFAEWAFPIAYTVGQIRRYKGTLYKCVQAHTSQEDWTPDTATSLWTPVADPAEEWPEWSQPVGAHDTYSKDAKVSHNGKHWISSVDGNVWEPGVYGWTEATVETEV